jgi:hypothetical protein
MLPRLRSQRPRLESSTQLRDAGDADDFAQLAVAIESDEPLSPEDEKGRRAYADWLARFDKKTAA